MHKIIDQITTSATTNIEIKSQHEGYSLLLTELDNLVQLIRAGYGGGTEAETIVVKLASLSVRYAIDQCQFNIETYI